MTDKIPNWEELPANELRGVEYPNAVRGWRNTETNAEVVVYAVEGTGMEEVTDKPWACQHPHDGDNNVRFADTRDEAEQFAKGWMRRNTEPADAY